MKATAKKNFKKLCKKNGTDRSKLGPIFVKRGDAPNTSAIYIYIYKHIWNFALIKLETWVQIPATTEIFGISFLCFTFNPVVCTICL